MKEFTINFPKSVYRSPVDGKAYVAEGGWQEYHPTVPKARSVGPVEVERIVLLTDQDKLEEYVSVPVLATYIKEIEKTATVHFSQAKKGTTSFEMVIESEVKPGNKSAYKIAARPEGLSTVLVKALYAKLDAIKAPAVKGPVRFQVLLRLWPR